MKFINFDKYNYEYIIIILIIHGLTSLSIEFYFGNDIRRKIIFYFFNDKIKRDKTMRLKLTSLVRIRS